MTDTRHMNADDLPLHAMHLLGAEEAREIEARLASDAEYRREYASVTDDLVLLAMTVDLEAPSEQARLKFLERVSREKRVIPIDRPAATTEQRNADAVATAPAVAAEMPVERQTRSSGKLLPWLGWAIAAGALFSAGSLYQERGRLQTTVAGQSAQLRAQTEQVATLSADAARAQSILSALTDPLAMRVTLNTTPGAKPLPQGRATYVASKGTLVFTANNLDPLPIGKTYELWVIPADGSNPVAAGTFRPDARGNASIIMPEIPVGVEAKAFGVTIEAEGGATKPTPPILLAGE